MRIIHKSLSKNWYTDSKNQSPFWFGIESHKDFYDSFQDFEDKEHLWLREPKVIEFSRNESNLLSKEFTSTIFSARLKDNKYYVNKYRDIYIDLSVLGFCGKLYNIFIIKGIDYKTIYENEIIEYYIQNMYTSHHSISKIERQKKDNVRYIKKVMEQNKSSKIINSFFLKYKTPIFLLCSSGLIRLLPHLHSLDFGSILNAGQTFQEIELYLTNELVSEKQIETSVGGNDVKIVAAGFDLKTSFRNM